MNIRPKQKQSLVITRSKGTKQVIHFDTGTEESFIFVAQNAPLYGDYIEPREVDPLHWLNVSRRYDIDEVISFFKNWEQPEVDSLDFPRSMSSEIVDIITDGLNFRGVSNRSTDTEAVRLLAEFVNKHNPYTFPGF